jgi:hypothetical protein
MYCIYLKKSCFPVEMSCKFLRLHIANYALMYMFVTMPGSRINTQAVAPLCGLFLTCGKSEPLEIIMIYTYIKITYRDYMGR